MNTLQSPEKPGWIARILLAVTTLALVVVGFFFFTVALVVGAIIALIVGVRFWWVLRKLKRAQGEFRDQTGDAARSGSHSDNGASVVEGEFKVVERESAAQPSPPEANNTPRRNDNDSTAHHERKS